jgi:hypothetical protein
MASLSRRRRGGLLRRRGYDDNRLNEQYETDAGNLDDQALRDLYGPAREVERFRGQQPSAPGYQARGRQLLTDGQGRSYTPVGPHEPNMAYVYVDIAETRQRNHDDTAPVEFPREGDTVRLWPIRRGKRDAEGLNYDPLSDFFERRLSAIYQERGRIASASVEFVERMPQVDEIETLAEERRRDAVLERQKERARVERDRY